MCVGLLCVNVSHASIGWSSAWPGVSDLMVTGNVPCAWRADTVCSNGVVQADLMIALGVRFDDRVTGKLEAFATHARIVHIDIDPAEIHKNKHAHIPICAGERWSVSLCGC